MLAGGDEISLFEGYFATFAALGCRCEFLMQRIVDVEERNGQFEHDLREVPLAMPRQVRLRAVSLLKNCRQ